MGFCCCLEHPSAYQIRNLAILNKNLEFCYQYSAIHKHCIATPVPKQFFRPRRNLLKLRPRSLHPKTVKTGEGFEFPNGPI